MTSRPHRLIRLLPAAAALTGILATTGTRAADPPKPPSAENGQQLAQRFCTNCHLVGSEQTTVGTIGPPPFTTIANKADQTADKIKGALILPHPPMPDMQLTGTEMMDLIAYIQTLRKADQPPLIPPPGETKPKYPKAG
jgi:cytochrome c2